MAMDANAGEKMVACLVIDAAQRRSGAKCRTALLHLSISNFLVKTAGSFRAGLEPFCLIPAMTQQGSECREEQGPFGAISRLTARVR